MNRYSLRDTRPFYNTLVFWWILFFLLQQAERLFLLIQAWEVEVPMAKDLGILLLTGLRADLMVSALLVGIASLLGGGFWLLGQGVAKWRRTILQREIFVRHFNVGAWLVALFLLLFLIVDMGYYGYNQQHLDYDFFEYVENLLASTLDTGEGTQATLQTEAELRQGQKWGFRLLGFLLLEAIAALAWWGGFRRSVAPILNRLWAGFPRYANVGLGMCLLVGVTGLDPYGPYAAQRAGITSTRYFTLAQNSLWYASAILIETIQSRTKGQVGELLNLMPLEEAMKVSRNLLHPGASFPYAQYPFVRSMTSDQGLRFEKPVNVLLLFLEGLDSRYMGRKIDLENPSHLSWKFLYDTPQYAEATEESDFPDPRIRLTPFLDQLRLQSVFFENFYSNGHNTSRGLFATFCSYYPKFGDPELRTRHSHDYLCLPSALRQVGYRTEMVIPFNRDDGRHHIGLFMARNGLDHLYDESDFPEDGARMGSGMTDEATFALIRNRLKVLQENGQPFLLAGLTVGTHHPYQVPLSHPEVHALQAHQDPYVHTLKFLDLALEQFFTNLKREGLLKNTVVFILGDHGRRVPVGGTDIEREIGIFRVPMYMWVDESLRPSPQFRPQIVSGITSQVDLTPTILAINGVMPRVAPFLGRDLSCVMVASACLQDNVAFVKSGRNKVIGFVDKEGVILHSALQGTWVQTDPLFRVTQGEAQGERVRLDLRARKLMALFVSTNVVFEQNRIWSWKEFGKAL